MSGHKCFSYDMKITTDKGRLKIGDIVENNIDCNVLSYNHNTNTFEYKHIKNKFKNEINQNFIELEIQDENNKIHKIKCTPSHKIYTENRGYVEAKNLTQNDLIIIS